MTKFSAFVLMSSHLSLCRAAFLATGFHTRTACTNRATICASELPSFELTLKKPLGIVFESGHEGEYGISVSEILDNGSAAQDGTIWPGDMLLEVASQNVETAGFDEAMNALMEAPELCELRFGRIRGRSAAVRFQGQSSPAFAAPGDELALLASRHDFEVQYGCKGGTCGVCEVVLKDTETEELCTVRMCRARVPQGERASLMPWEVLRKESEEALIFYKELEDKYSTSP